MPNDYIMPSRLASEDARLGFLKETIREGEAFLKGQTCYSDFRKGKDIISGTAREKVSDKLSRTNVNLQKRIIRESIGTLSNIRPLWGYQTDNRDLAQGAAMLNKLLLAWYQNTFADRAIKGTLQYAQVFGSGFIGPDWQSDFWTRGRGDIVLKSYSPEDVLVYQLPKDNNIQRAYAVTIREEVPINLARSMFPTLADKIQPDRTAPNSLARTSGKLASFLSPVLNRFAASGNSRRPQPASFPVVDIYRTYIMDLTVNEGPGPVVMGEPGTYWSYTVPVLGSDIPDGVNLQGQPVFRKATPEDAMLYPFRRLVTWCNSTLLRDNTSYWWHGMVPLVQISLDKWVWEFLGIPVTRDLDPLEQSTNSLRRAVDDSANARLRPALQYDDRTMSKSLMESLDVRKPGQAVGVDMTMGERPVRPILDSTYYDVPQWILQVIQGNDEMMKYLSGIVDLTAIAKARQIPSSDTVEKIFEMAGPMVTDMSREMEASLGQLGEMIKCMFFEFYTTARRVQLLGRDGVTPQDFDYEPGNLIPSHLPGEDPSTPSKTSQVERARRYMNSFYFHITPNSLHQITQLSRKLILIQLQKAGVPIDPWTMAEANDIPNFGPPPEGTTTVMERWVAFEKMKGELQAHIQAKTQEIVQAEQMQFAVKAAMLQAGAGQPPQGPPQGPPGGPQGLGPQGGPPQNLPQPSPSPALGHNAPGRPPNVSGNPQIVQKDGGTRSTITGPA